MEFSMRIVIATIVILIALVVLLFIIVGWFNNGGAATNSFIDWLKGTTGLPSGGGQPALPGQ